MRGSVFGRQALKRSSRNIPKRAQSDLLIGPGGTADTIDVALAGGRRPHLAVEKCRAGRWWVPELTHIRIFKIAGFKLVVEAAYRIIWLGKPVEDHRSDDEEEAPAETPMTKKKGQ